MMANGKHLHKTATDISGSSTRKPPFYRMKNGMRKVGKVAAKILFTGFLTWAALTSSANTTQAQTKEITQKIEFVGEKKEINTTGIQKAEVRGKYVYFWTATDSFMINMDAALEKLKIGEGVSKVETFDNGAVIFSKYGILDITFIGEKGTGQYVFSTEPIRDFYCDEKNRTSIGANEYCILIINSLGRVAVGYKLVSEGLKVDIKPTKNLKLEADPNNDNLIVLSFDGKPTLVILSNIKDPNEDLIKHVSEKIGSGN